MKRKLVYAIMVIISMTALNGCEDEDLEKVYDEKTSLDSPFLFSEGYQDTIAIPYDLPTPITDWLSMVKDETKVCKLSIPGTHDTMTGMGFYQPVLKYVFNTTAISQVSTLEEQMASGLRFFDIRPVVSIDTLATDPAEKQILRLSHGISEIDVTFEETIDQLQRYLKDHRKATYTPLLTSGKLNTYLSGINEQAQERFERLIDGMKQAQGITEQLKAENALEWVRRMNNIRACAMEIVNKEIIFA